MLGALEAAAIKEGKIGIVNVNAATASAVAVKQVFVRLSREVSLRFLKHNTVKVMQPNLKISLPTI